MNTDTITGTANTATGQAKEAAGAATGDTSLRAGGILDQITGTIQKTIGDATSGTGQSGEMVGKAKQFAKDRPWAAAALAGVVGMAVLNTLRGKR